MLIAGLHSVNRNATDVVLDGPGQVKAGEEAVFDVTYHFKDQPYLQSDIRRVKYILYDATGAVVTVGEAEAVADGQYQVTLDAERNISNCQQVRQELKLRWCRSLWLFPRSHHLSL